MHEAPFTRYESCAAIERDASALSARFGTYRYFELLKFAHSHRLSKPPLLANLPEVIELRMQYLRQRTITTERVDVTSAGVCHPIPTFEDISGTLELSDDWVIDWDHTAAMKQAAQLVGVTDNSLSSALHMHDALRKEVYSYVKTRKPLHSLRDVKRMVFLVTALFPGNEDIHHALSHASATDGVYQCACLELLLCRIPAFLEIAVRLDFKRLCRSIKGKLLHIGLPTPVRATLVSHLNEVSTIEQYRELATSRAPILLRKSNTDTSVSQRVIETLKSALTDHGRVTQIYHEWFLPKHLKMLQKAYTPRRIGDVKIIRTEKIVSESTVEDVLFLYPTKDYLDLLKGAVSHDCTDGSGTGARHLATPEFFNMRIYRNDEWIGNIYCLDFSHFSKTMIIDHIQVPPENRVLWVSFFQALHRTMQEHFKGITVLLPRSSISNHAQIRAAYATYQKAMPKRHYAPNVYEERRPRFRAFESIRYHKSFLVFCGEHQNFECALDLA